jgi:hypothetical protein
MFNSTVMNKIEYIKVILTYQFKQETNIYTILYKKELQ